MAALSSRLSLPLFFASSSHPNFAGTTHTHHPTHDPTQAYFFPCHHNLPRWVLTTGHNRRSVGPTRPPPCIAGTAPTLVSPSLSLLSFWRCPHNNLESSISFFPFLTKFPTRCRTRNHRCCLAYSPTLAPPKDCSNWLVERGRRLHTSPASTTKLPRR